MSKEDTKALTPDAKTLGRNTIINFVGQVIVALSAVIMVPYIVRGLGYSAYGLLSLALMIFGSFSLLELGLGRATTKFVAEYLHSKEYDKISSVVWKSLVVQVLLGSIGGLILALFSSTIASKLNLQKDMVLDAEKMLKIIACSLPLVLGSSALRGALEGSQRFDLVNYVKILLNISTYLIPLIGARISLGIPGIVLTLLISRFVATIVYFVLCLYTLPQIRSISIFGGINVSSLFSYAGWVAISNLIVPLLVQIDRYFIATLVSVASVTFYTVPYEILNGLWIIPGSIAAVLFPAFSSSKYNDSGLQELFCRPINYIAILLGPIIIVFIVFSREILFLWQGLEIAENSYIVLQLLAFGVLINSLGWVPSNLVMGFGRPDIIAKIHLFQVPFYIVTAFFFINKFGIIGAAFAFLLRVILESILFFVAAFFMEPMLKKVFITRTAKSIASLFVLLPFLIGIKYLADKPLICLVSIALAVTSYYSAIWKMLLDDVDKQQIARLLKR